MLPAMTLHWSPRSPYVRKVMIVAHEIGLADHITITRTVVGGTTPHLDLMRQNPLGKIPTLVTADGTVLYDSAVICEYLDTLHDDARLFPPTGPTRFLALRRLALGDGMLDVALAWLGERFRPAERQSPPHITLWHGKLLACLDALEQEATSLRETPFSIGHIGIGVALGYLDFRFAELAWREKRPDLAAWQSEFDRRPAVHANLPLDDR